MKKLIAGALAGVAMLVSNGVHGQDIFTDVIREAVDEVRLNQDYRALQRDLAVGNTAGAQYDMMRIQQDSSNLARDQMQLNYDLNRGGSVFPYQNYGQNYGGYYYPNSAGQLYYAPNQAIPAMNQPISQQMLPPLNPVPSASAFVPVNPVPGVPQIVRISNPDSTGVTLSFVFGGKTYSVDSGRTEEFTVTAPTIVSFSRGGQAGVARYTLAGGNTFEFKYDNSGWYMVQKRPDLVSQSTNPVPTNPVPANAAWPNSVPPSPVALPSTSPGPGPIAP